mmetsp:Transcript_33548/g.99880  ORF Transcript_33548/g.99880 Transcript_33548/m.99880 type:complete len:301 (-) Transcript_33548:500-1402(-)
MSAAAAAVAPPPAHLWIHGCASASSTLSLRASSRHRQRFTNERPSADMPSHAPLDTSMSALRASSAMPSTLVISGASPAPQYGSRPENSQYSVTPTLHTSAFAEKSWSKISGAMNASVPVRLDSRSERPAAAPNCWLQPKSTALSLPDSAPSDPAAADGNASASIKQKLAGLTSAYMIPSAWQSRTILSTSAATAPSAASPSGPCASTWRRRSPPRHTSVTRCTTSRSSNVSNRRTTPGHDAPASVMSRASRLILRSDDSRLVMPRTLRIVLMAYSWHLLLCTASRTSPNAPRPSLSLRL